MTGKPVIPRGRTVRDVEAIVDGDLAEDAERAALGFVAALERAYAHIGAHPATGSSRCAFEPGLPGLRSWPLGHYPHLVFYVERDDRIDVWRVLHGRCDIARWMRESADGDDA